MKKYGDHIPFFEREIASLGQQAFDLSFQSFLEVLATSGTAAADAAVRSFAATLSWPPVSDPVRLELCMRLSCAKWWCKECEGLDAADEEGKEFLESVLIDYWRNEGRLDWLQENYCLTEQEKREMKSQ
jgi:hypothetical protein